MATTRRIRCLIYTLLPVLGIMLLLSRILSTTTMFKYGGFAKGSKSIVDTFQWGVMVDDEHVMLLKPKNDESRLVRLIPADVKPSQIQTVSQGVHKKRKYPTDLLNLMSPDTLEVSFDSEVNSGNQLKAKVQRQHFKAEFPSHKASDNSTEDLEEQFFQAVNPAAAEQPTLKNDKIHILIVTNRRSGSSFLGQFFNQHPRMFFQFEPLKLTEWKKEFYPDRFSRIEYLRHLVKCEFDKTPYLAEFYSREPLHRTSSRLMSNPPLCNLSYPRPLPESVVRTCEPLETVPLMQACKKQQHQAVKLIRLSTISSLEPLALDPDINLKIIHLVRDPRGTHVSKSKFLRPQVSLQLGKSLDHEVSYLCRRIKQNLEFVRSRPAWLQGKYKLVRYEDIAYHPQKLAREIYDFTGLGQLPHEILDWIDANTKNSVIRQREKKGIFNHYSTARNASQVSEAWRKHVTLQVVLRMQRLCRETLRDLGYLEVRTVKDLTDNKKTLVAKLPVS